MKNNVKLVCMSHSPLMDHIALDRKRQEQVLLAITKVRKEVEQFDPELIIIFGPDHFNGFFYDLMPAFCLGTKAAAVGDFGIGSGNLRVPETIALECAQHLLGNEIDITTSYSMWVDHGLVQTLTQLTGSVDHYEVIPIFINAAAPPLPSCKRARLLGATVGTFVQSLNKRTLIVGSGGLSHDPPIPQMIDANHEIKNFLISGRQPTAEARAAREARTIETGKRFSRGEANLLELNPEWDRNFLSILSSQELQRLDSLTYEDIESSAGKGGQEIRSWIAAFAALQSIGPYWTQVEFYRPIPEWIVGMGIMTAALHH